MRNQNITVNEKEIKRLSQSIVTRRIELGFRSARSFGLYCGLDYRTITRIESERAREVTRSTLALIESKLNWPSGYLNALIATA